MNVRIAALLRKLDRTHELAKRIELERELHALGYQKPEPKKELPVIRQVPELKIAIPNPPKEMAASAPKRGPGRPRKEKAEKAGE